MKFKTFTGDVDIVVTTVILKETKKQNLDLFRCCHCGRGVSHNSGEIVKVFPGFMPSNQVFTSNRCLQSNCRQYYSFQTERSKAAWAEVSLLLLPGKHEETFHCFVCGNPIVTYSERTVHDISENTDNTLPYLGECPNLTCQKQYDFIEILTLEQ